MTIQKVFQQWRKACGVTGWEYGEIMDLKLRLFADIKKTLKFCQRAGAIKKDYDVDYILNRIIGKPITEKKQWEHPPSD